MAMVFSAFMIRIVDDHKEIKAAANVSGEISRAPSSILLRFHNQIQRQCFSLLHGSFVLFAELSAVLFCFAFFAGANMKGSKNQ